MCVCERLNASAHAEVTRLLRAPRPHVETLMGFERPRLRRFVPVRRLMPRGRRMKCSPRSARRWRPSEFCSLLNAASHPELCCPGGPRVKLFSRSISTLRRSQGDSPTCPHTCARHTVRSLNSSGMHVPRHSQQSVQPFCFLTLTKRLAVTLCFTHSHCLTLTLTSIYAANCRTEADNCTEKIAFPAVTESMFLVETLSAVSPPARRS